MTLLQRAIERTVPQVHTLLLSCNEPLAGIPPGVEVVLSDPLASPAGPLSGVLAGLEYLADRKGCAELLLSVAVDTPWFPMDLTQRLALARDCCSADIALAASASGEHPVFALWPVTLAGALRGWLERGCDRSVRRFQARYRTVVEHWVDDGCDPFLNINTPADLAAIEQPRRPHA